MKERIMKNGNGKIETATEQFKHVFLINKTVCCRTMATKTKNKLNTTHV